MPTMTPVGNTGILPNPNQGLNTLSSILGVQQQQQALQTGQIGQEAAQAQTTQEQQKNSEMQAAQGLAFNGAKSGRYTNPDGSLNRQKMADDISRVAPTYGQPIAGQLLSQANEIVHNQQAHQNLNQSQQERLGAGFGSLAMKKDLSPSDFVDELDRQVSLNPDPQFRRMAISMAAHIPAQNSTPQQLQELARRWATAATSPDSATGQTNPAMGTMQSPGGLQAINTNPQAPGGVGPRGQPMTQGVAPAVTQSPQGDLGVVGSSGTIRPLTATGGQQAPPSNSKLEPLRRPGMNAPAVDQQNYNARIKSAGDEYDAVRGAANNPQNGVQVNRYRNSQILDLTKIAPTGPGKDIWNHFASQFTGESGDAFQKIGHYLAQNSASLAKTMGVPNTNMGAETAAASGGNTAQNPNAIKEITRVNDALNTAFDLYNRGLAKVTNNGSDFSRAAAYKQAFGSTLDVNALRWADAHRRNDKEEIESLRSQFGDKEIEGFKRKLGVLKSLADKGDLP